MRLWWPCSCFENPCDTEEFNFLAILLQFNMSMEYFYSSFFIPLFSREVSGHIQHSWSWLAPNSLKDVSASSPLSQPTLLKTLCCVSWTHPYLISCCPLPERAIARHEVREIEQRHTQDNLRERDSSASSQSAVNEDDLVIIYNRVPKTASTSFTNIAYDLCGKNHYHVLHINTTKNNPVMSIQDQVRAISGPWRLLFTISK